MEVGTVELDVLTHLRKHGLGHSGGGGRDRPGPAGCDRIEGAGLKEAATYTVGVSEAPGRAAAAACSPHPWAWAST